MPAEPHQLRSSSSHNGSSPDAEGAAMNGGPDEVRLPAVPATRSGNPRAGYLHVHGTPRAARRADPFDHRAGAGFRLFDHRRGRDRLCLSGTWPNAVGPLQAPTAPLLVVATYPPGLTP